MKKGIHVKKWSAAWMGVSEGGAWKRGQGLIRSRVDGGEGEGVPLWRGGGHWHCTCASQLRLVQAGNHFSLLMMLLVVVSQRQIQRKKKQTKKDCFVRIPSQGAKWRFL